MNKTQKTGRNEFMTRKCSEISTEQANLESKCFLCNVTESIGAHLIGFFVVLDFFLARGQVVGNVWEFLKVVVDSLNGRQRSDNGEVGDSEIVSGDVLGLGQKQFKVAKGLIKLLHLLGVLRLLIEDLWIVSLRERLVQSSHVEKQALVDQRAFLGILRIERLRLPIAESVGQILQDGTALRQDQPIVDQNRDRVLRIKLDEFRFELLSGEEVDRLQVQVDSVGRRSHTNSMARCADEMMIQIDSHDFCDVARNRNR